jgi:hypothetical protein
MALVVIRVMNGIFDRETVPSVAFFHVVSLPRCRDSNYTKRTNYY